MSEPETFDVRLKPSKHFHDWLASTGGSFAFTSYQAGRVFVLGHDETDGPRGHELQFRRSMGLGLSHDKRKLLVATEHQVYRFDNFLIEPGDTRDGADAVFVPRMSWVTGDVDAHDIGFDSNDRPVFVNTSFNCLATVSDGYSFTSLWQPKFISEIVNEDRCHLNGLAMVDGVPRYVTAVSTSDQAGAWRDDRIEGGVVIDVRTNTVVCRGLSMPHSPRWHQGRLWVLNSGRGEFGHVNVNTGVFTPIAICPGYARGLSFVGDFAIVALSLARDNKTFAGLPLEGVLTKHKLDPRCGVMVVNIKTGQIVAGVTITGRVRELFDVQFLPQMRTPRIVGFRTDDIKRLISIDGRRK